MAAINVKELYDLVAFEARKAISGGFFSDEKFNSFLKESELFVFEFYYKYYEQNQDLVDHMKPFVVYNAIFESDKQGKVTFPADYAHRVAFEGLYIQNPVSPATTVEITRYPCPYLPVNEISFINTSKIAKPSLEKGKQKFYHTYRNDQTELFPKGIFYVGFSYLRYPVFGKITHTMTEVDGQDKYEFDEANSLNLEWDDITRWDIAAAMLYKLGISLNDTMMVSIAKDADKQSLLSYITEIQKQK